MKIYALIFAASLTATPVLADDVLVRSATICPNPMPLKDGFGQLQMFATTTDELGNCMFVVKLSGVQGVAIPPSYPSPLPHTDTK